MNKVLITVGCVVIAFGYAPAAFAQDFTGPFVGVQGGYERTDVANPETELGILAMDSEVESFTGGMFLGYDHEVLDRVVLGAELGFDISADDVVASSTGMTSIDPDWSIDLTARAGYLVTPKTLAYVRGGYTNARVETTTTVGALQTVEDENRDGWLVGAGVEQKLLPNMSARLEYRYSDLSEGEGTWDRHRMLAGISYRF